MTQADPQRPDVTMIGLQLAAFEQGLHDRLRTLPGARILDRLGWTRMLRVAVTALWVISLIQVATIFRPDLLRPADIGSDTSNYVATAERLVAGHEIYALQAGDRPVPLDNPPEWSVPILSPPTIATAFAWAPALPDAVRFYPSWALGVAATIGVGLLAIAVSPPLFLFLMLQVMPWLAITAWSGNVNAIIAGVLALAWLGGRTSSRSLQALAGIAIAVAICVKIGPLFAGWWLLWQGRRLATIAMVAAGGMFLGLTALLAGPSSFFEFLDVIRASAANPSPFSIPGLLMSLGVPSGLAALALPVVLLAMAAVIVLLRSHPTAFLFAVLGTIFATTVVRYESIGLVVVAGIAWAGTGLLVPRLPRATDRPGMEEPLPRREGWAAAGVGAAAAVAGIVISLAVGGRTTSQFAVTNESDRTIVARLHPHGQEATFGFVIPAGASLTGWTGRTGGSPPLLTIWSTTCELVSTSAMPDIGGLVTVTAGGANVAPQQADAPLAPFDASCAGQAREESAQTAAER